MRRYRQKRVDISTARFYGGDIFTADDAIYLAHLRRTHDRYDNKAEMLKNHESYACLS